MHKRTVQRLLIVVAAVAAWVGTIGPASALPPRIPSVGPGELFGYIALSSFGVAPVAISDESIVNFNVPAFAYAGDTYNKIGVTSNGTLVIGGATGEDLLCCNLPAGPSAARPNNVLAPFWTDLDGTGTPGIFASVLTDGTENWIVVEWQVKVFGTASARTFQVWLGLNGVEDVTFAYPTPPADPFGQPFLVGAENALGQGDMEPVLPTTDLRVTSSPAPPGSVITGDVPGAVTVNAGENVSISDGRVVGAVTVNPGGSLTVANSSINGGISVNGGYLSLCGSRVSAGPSGVALSVTNSPVSVVVGDPATGCAGNRFVGDVTLTANRGVVFGANQVSRNVTIDGSGSQPTVIKANTIVGALSCTGNSPAPTNSGQANTAASKSGQCADL